MDEKIAADLFARLMQLSAPTRKDLLEYLGQGPVSADSLLREVFFRQGPAGQGAVDAQPSQPE